MSCAWSISEACCVARIRRDDITVEYAFHAPSYPVLFEVPPRVLWPTWMRPRAGMQRFLRLWPSTVLYARISHILNFHSLTSSGVYVALFVLSIVTCQDGKRWSRVHWTVVVT
jgi:hypothetical protein